MQQLSLHLAENLAELDARFGASADYYAKEIMIYHCRGCIVLFDGMASLDSLWELLLDAASRQALQQPCPCTGQEVYEHILHGSASPAESTPVIFVASITSIAVFVTPALYEPATLLRIGVVVAAGLAGPVGLAGAFFVLLLSLSGTGMLGVPYLAQHPFPQSPLAEDGVIRRNYRHLSRKGFNIWQKRRPRA